MSGSPLRKRFTAAVTKLADGPAVAYCSPISCAAAVRFLLAALSSSVISALRARLVHPSSDERLACQAYSAEVVKDSCQRSKRNSRNIASDSRTKPLCAGPYQGLPTKQLCECSASNSLANRQQTSCKAERFKNVRLSFYPLPCWK